MAAPPRALTARIARRRRLHALPIALASGTLLGVAAYLTPSDAGMGTHEALGLPECGWITAINLPCPSCGMTTAFAHAAEGDLLASFATQPMGGLLALMTAIVFLLSSWVLLSGSAVGGTVARGWTKRWTWGMAVFALAAWGYKIASYRGLI